MPCFQGPIGRSAPCHALISRHAGRLLLGDWSVKEMTLPVAANKPSILDAGLGLNPDDLFGNEAAEDEPLPVFRHYAVERPELDRFLNLDQPVAIVRAYKGDGKSALLRLTELRLKERMKEALVVRCTAADLDYETDAPTDLDATKKAWKDSLFKRIAGEIGSRIRVPWTGDARRLVKTAEDLGLREPGFLKAILRGFTVKAAAAKAEISVAPAINHSSSSPVDSLVARYLDSPVWLLVDDVDQNFRNTENERIRIASYLNAVRELANQVPDLRLRTTIRPTTWTIIKREFESLSHVSQYLVDLTWNEADARRLLAKRVEGFLQRHDKLTRFASSIPSDTVERENFFCSLVFEARMPWGGADRTRPPHVVLHTLSKHRPRWMIELSKAAARKAVASDRGQVTLQDINGVLQEFGRKRIEDTVAEFRVECPQIEELIGAFRGSQEQFATDALLKFIDNQILSHLSPSIAGVHGKPSAREVANLLFRIGLYYGRDEFADGSYKHVTYTEAPNLFLSRTDMDRGLSWEMHPVYRQELHMRDAHGREVVRKRRGNTRPEIRPLTSIGSLPSPPPAKHEPKPPGGVVRRPKK